MLDIRRAAAGFADIDEKCPASYVKPAPMAQLPIISAPDPRLKIKARPVPAVDAKVRRLMDDMLDTMYQAIGIGLAAPQVGQSSRVIVLDVAREGEKPQPLRLANPEILWRSPELATFSEGCLSLPEHYADVTRPHEIEHLDGILFVDHLSLVKRGMILRKLAKAKRIRDPVPA